MENLKTIKAVFELEIESIGGILTILRKDDICHPVIYKYLRDKEIYLLNELKKVITEIKEFKRLRERSNPQIAFCL